MLRRDWYARHIAGISIALLIQSFDPLECGDWHLPCSIDIALLWSAGRWWIRHTIDISLRWSEEDRRVRLVGSSDRPR